jgi:hypothetical protein
MVNRKYISIYSLLFFCGSLLWSVSSASAKECTPVVYAFRHAEDSQTNLTEVGLKHADLYQFMVNSFGSAHNYCPVAFVYSMYQTNPDGSPGTNNPYQTAAPLAILSCYNSPFVSSQYLATCPFFPRTSLENGGKLYEYLGVKGAPPTTERSATGDQLRKELIKMATSALPLLVQSGFKCSWPGYRWQGS